jgi:hypothetical protein
VETGWDLEKREGEREFQVGGQQRRGSRFMSIEAMNVGPLRVDFECTIRKLRISIDGAQLASLGIIVFTGRCRFAFFLFLPQASRYFNHRPVGRVLALGTHIVDDGGGYH